MDSTTTQTASEGLRERKKLATRQALALAAVRLAVERGLENIRVEDITDAVNVSRRTFTNYFASKEEAIASVSADRFARAARALRDRPASEPVADSLAEVFADQHQAAAQLDREQMAPIRMLMTSPALQGEALKAMVAAEGPLAEAIAERTGADPQGDLRPQVLAAAVMGAVRIATALWGTGDGSLPDLIRQAVRQVAERPAADAAPHQAPAPASASPGSKSR
jgi:AcrR family transcriptional regulator